LDLNTLIWLLPIIFMIHDFEEIIMMNSWIKRNRHFLLNKFPKLAKRLLSNYDNLSTSSFSLAVAEEFIIIGISAFLAIQFHWYLLWIACFMAFSIHLILHIIQWLIIRTYIPAIFTSILALNYSIITFRILIISNLYTIKEFILIGVFGMIIMFLNLLFIHKMAARFEIFLANYEKTTNENILRRY